MTVHERIKSLRKKAGISQKELANRVGLKTASAINKIELGLRDINHNKIIAFAKALNTTPSYLMGWEDSMNAELPSPTIAEDVVTIPIVGSVAAGYDSIAIEDWSGDVIEVPRSYLRGRSQSEFFGLEVHGDSMYPLYMDGDKVLVLKQTTLNRSGDIGVIIYDDEKATLKKIEYVNGEDWLEMIPINPNYPPKRIEGVELERCRVLGIPWVLVRQVNPEQ